MSSSLMWRPVVQGGNLGYTLKKAIANYFWGHDGSCHGDWIEIDDSAVPYLRGVRDGANDELRKEVEELLALLEQQGRIEIGIFH